VPVRPEGATSCPSQVLALVAYTNPFSAFRKALDFGSIRTYAPISQRPTDRDLLNQTIGKRVDANLDCCRHAPFLYCRR
jgi:hypothetical protein